MWSRAHAMFGRRPRVFPMSTLTSSPPCWPAHKSMAHSRETTMPSDTSEKGLEEIIEKGLCARRWTKGTNDDFDSAFAIDLEQLRRFIRETQPALELALDLGYDSPT